MKEPQFTPGPWSIEKSEYPDGAGYFYIKAKSEIIGGDCLMFQGVKTNIANAFLMAAAPKMFNALNKCLDFLKRCPMTRNAELEREIETTLNEATNTEITK